MKFSTFAAMITIVLACVFSVNAQVVEDWMRTYHGPANGGGIRMMTVNNDFIYVSGQDAGSAVALDIVTIKYNTIGDSLWVKRYGNGGESQVTGLTADDSGNLYVTGYTVISGLPRSVLLKYSPSGNLLWSELYESSPDTRSVGVALDSYGNPCIAVSSNLNGVDWGVEVVKYDASTGDTVWTARYDESASSVDIPFAMTVDNQDNVYVTGYSQSGLIQSMLIKYDGNGNFQWDALYNIPSVTGEIQGRAIKTDNDGNIYVAGHCYAGQATFVDFLVMKYFPNGDTAWVKVYSNSFSTDEAYDLAVDNSGDVYVAGKSYIGGGGSNNYDYLTVKFSTDGTPLWQALYDGPAAHTEDEARVVLLDSYDNCYVSGGSSISPLYNSWEYATVKYDPDGNQVWSIRHESGSASGIGIDSDYNIYVAGNLLSSFVVIKYSQPGFPPYLIYFSENFDGVTAPAFPEGWTGCLDVLISNTVAEIKTLETGIAPSLPNAVFMMNGLDGSNGQPDTTAFVALVSPLVDFGDFGGVVTFQATGSCALQVGIMTDPNDASTFTQVEEVAITTEFAEYSVTLPAAGTGYIAIKHSNQTPVTVLFVDDVEYMQEVPVELTSFTADVNKNGEVMLNWSTATEMNNRGFYVERLASEGEWESIGFIAGNGTTTEPRSYTYKDNDVVSGSYSYRLKQVDFDGSYEYSKTVEVEVSTPAEFSLSQNYPNPFNPSTRISYSIPRDGYVSLRIFNVLGQEVAKLINNYVKAGEHTVNFNASGLSSGIYYYRMESGNRVMVRKMTLIK